MSRFFCQLISIAVIVTVVATIFIKLTKAALLFYGLIPSFIGSTYYNPLEKYGASSPDHIYIINLKTNPDRYAFMSNQLKEYGLKYARFDAINGYELTIKNLNTGKTFKGKDIDAHLHDGANYQVICSDKLRVNITPRMKWNNSKFSAGELGCACSHMSIWRDIIHSNKKSALILEDDAVLEGDFQNKLYTLLNNTPYSYDLLYLMLTIPFTAYKSKPLEENLYNQYTLKIVKNPKSSHNVGYIVTNTGASKLLRLSQPLDNPIDHHMADVAQKLNMHIARNYLVSVNQNFESNITKMGRNNLKSTLCLDKEQAAIYP